MVPFIGAPAVATIRILIVDDVQQVREDLRTLLPLMGEIEVVGEAINGLDAVCRAESLRPDVVLMDLEMPILDGYEAARQIKKQNPACRVIALTINDFQDTRQMAAQAGVDAFIIKGAAVETLVNVITEGKE